MVDFFISKLITKNFRGLREFELSFASDAPCVLIGPNNCGKTSVLDAIGLCVGSPKFSKYELNEFDFWRGSDGVVADSFQIDIVFSARPGGSLPAVKGGVGDPILVHGMRVFAQSDDVSVNRSLIDEAGGVILLNLGAPISKGKQQQFKGQKLTGRRYATVADIRKWMPDIWQLDAKNLFQSLYVWKSGPLQRLLELYKQHLFEDEWETKSKRAMPAALHQVEAFLRDQALLTPFWKDTLAPGFKDKIRQYLGRATSVDVRPGLNDIEQWIMSEFQMQVSPSSDMSAVDVKRLGDGWQSLLRLAALELVVEHVTSGRRIALLAEEPETYLHPHLRRRLRSVFGSLQAAGHQVLLSTHSPESISFSENLQIVRLTMNNAGVEHHVYSTATAADALRAEEKFHERGNHELVFASCVVLTEGKPDECAVRLGLEKTGLDLDAESVSVVDCGGVANIPDYAEVCRALGIPWIAIHDADRLPDGTRKGNTQTARTRLDSLKSILDTILEWENDLEEAIGYRAVAEGKVRNQWIVEQLGAQSWPDIQKSVKTSSYTSVITALDKKLRG